MVIELSQQESDTEAVWRTSLQSNKVKDETLDKKQLLDPYFKQTVNGAGSSEVLVKFSTAREREDSERTGQRMGQRGSRILKSGETSAPLTGKLRRPAGERAKVWPQPSDEVDRPEVETVSEATGVFFL